MAKTKKEKSLEQMLDETLVKENEWPYRIPDNWIFTKLGCVCSKPQYGWTTKAVDKGSVKLLRTTDITSGNIDWHTVPFCTKIPEDLTKYLLNDGDIVISRAGSIGVSYLIRSPQRSVFASYLIRFKPNINKEYLYLFLKNPYYWASISEKSAGIALQNINATKLSEITFPLAPLEEQKRIVKKLSSMLAKLKEARELIQEAKDSFENRRAAILNKAFTGELTIKWRYENSDVRNNYFDKDTYSHPPFQIPSSWKWVNFKEVAEVKSKLVSPTKYSSFPHIAPNSIEKYTGRLISFNTIEEDGVTSPKHFFYKGQIIYSKIRPNLSKLIISEFDGLCSADMYPISTILNLNYLFHYMLSNTFLDFASNAGTRTILPKINQKELYSLPVPCPPIGEQNEIVKILDKLLAKEYKVFELLDLESHIELSEKSILSKAFRGELGTNNSEDEPAIKLLERIFEEKKSKPIILKPDDIKTSGSVSKPELLVKGPSDNTQVLLEEIESKYGNKTFRANELKDISKLSYDELKDALFELLESKLTMEFDENEEVITYQLKK